MKRGGKALILIVLLELLLGIGMSFFFWRAQNRNDDRPWRVEVVRITREIRAGRVPDPSGCDYVTDVRVFDASETVSDEFAVAEAPDGTLYRISYRIGKGKAGGLLWIGISWALVILLTLGIALYIRRKLLRPFGDLSKLPEEIARGTLSVPLKEEKSRYFGKFLWGMDMLRDNIETERERNLELEKEKKTLILSLSHDIKTPISAIRLYNKALAEGLYEEEEKKQEAYRGIEKNTELLEEYVEDIRKTAREDFLRISVADGAWYLSRMIKKVEELYREKTAIRHTGFTVAPYEECLLKGDENRALEVMQNLMENALKYGDGREIGISFADEEDCRLVTVRSTGGALPEQEMVNIFDSFYRGSNAGDAPGSGMGLYICRGIMNAMDGDIFAEEKDGAFLVTAVFRKK